MNLHTLEVLFFAASFLALVAAVWYRLRRKQELDLSEFPDLTVSKAGKYRRVILHQDIAKDLGEGAFDLSSVFVIRLTESHPPGSMFAAIEYPEAYIRFEGVKVIAEIEPMQYLCVAIRKTLPKNFPYSTPSGQMERSQ